MGGVAVTFNGNQGIFSISIDKLANGGMKGQYHPIFDKRPQNRTVEQPRIASSCLFIVRSILCVFYRKLEYGWKLLEFSRDKIRRVRTSTRRQRIRKPHIISIPPIWQTTTPYPTTAAEEVAHTADHKQQQSAALWLIKTQTNAVSGETQVCSSVYFA